MLKLLSICGKIQKIFMKNACIECNKSCITTKFGTKVAHAKSIPYAEENSEILTDVRDNNAIVFFRRKALNFEMLYLGSL